MYRKKLDTTEQLTFTHTFGGLYEALYILNHVICESMYLFGA